MIPVLLFLNRTSRNEYNIQINVRVYFAQYSYTNVQSRRREIAVVELYEGGSPWNDTVYSSIARLMSGGGVGLGPTAPLTDPTPAALTQPAQPRILVLRQTYLLPQSSHISRARVTLSEHGVTTKSLISELSPLLQVTY